MIPKAQRCHQGLKRKIFERISCHNCDEDFLPQLRRGLPIEMPCLLLLHCTGPLPIAGACRQGNSGEKKNCSIFAPFNYFSQPLSAFQAFLPIFEPFKNVSQSSFTPATLERGHNVALILPSLSIFVKTSFAQILFNYIVATVIENSSSSSQDFLEVSGLKRYSATDNLTFNRCGNQRHLKKGTWGGNVG